MSKTPVQAKDIADWNNDIKLGETNWFESPGVLSCTPDYLHKGEKCLLAEDSPRGSIRWPERENEKESKRERVAFLADSRVMCRPSQLMKGGVE